MLSVQLRVSIQLPPVLNKCIPHIRANIFQLPSWIIVFYSPPSWYNLCPHGLSDMKARVHTPTNPHHHWMVQISANKAWLRNRRHIKRVKKEMHTSSLSLYTMCIIFSTLCLCMCVWWRRLGCLLGGRSFIIAQHVVYPAAVWANAKLFMSEIFIILAQLTCESDQREICSDSANCQTGCPKWDLCYLS